MYWSCQPHLSCKSLTETYNVATQHHIKLCLSLENALSVTNITVYESYFASLILHQVFLLHALYKWLRRGAAVLTTYAR